MSQSKRSIFPVLQSLSHFTILSMLSSMSSLSMSSSSLWLLTLLIRSRKLFWITTLFCFISSTLTSPSSFWTSPYASKWYLGCVVDALSADGPKRNNNRNNQNDDIFDPDPKRVNIGPEPFSSSSSDMSTSDLSTRRQVLLTWPIGIGGAVLYGKLVADAAEKLSRGDIVYPPEHEQRVEQILTRSLIESAESLLSTGSQTDDAKSATSGSARLDRPLRVLEVGIGKEWRIVRRGLYHTALDQLSARDIVSQIELTGIDISVPSNEIVQDAQRRMEKDAIESSTRQEPIQVQCNAYQGSITSKIQDFPDGYFDSVICSLTLCSVDEPDEAIREIKRLVRPAGGTFGYIEHVAVNDDEPYQVLKYQQQVFDPIQQLVADNCHLRRYTGETIENIFLTTTTTTKTTTSAKTLYSERFLVDKMWPVSCQICGVIQRLS